MNEQTLTSICGELESALAGRRFGKIFALSRFRVAVDFRLPDSTYLFISVEPNDPRIYLIKRRMKDLERQSGNPSAFILYLRKRLSGFTLDSITKIPDERVLQFHFTGENELGGSEDYSLAVQLTGRSSNIFLLDRNGFILESMRESVGRGQDTGDRFAPPVRETPKGPTRDESVIGTKPGESVSEALDAFYLEKEADKHFRSHAEAARKKLKLEISKREKLVKKLKTDLEEHGEADRWKRFGDLILANLSTAMREGETIVVTDYFDESLPEVRIKADENRSLTEAAESFFKRYTKARNAAAEIAKRLDTISGEIRQFHERQGRLERAIGEKDLEYIQDLSGQPVNSDKAKPNRKPADIFAGARSFRSSDGYEILVGKKAKDNDHLTFRVAKSLDLWLHAADYPGSHVVVRNPNRQEIPQKTLLEAAELAAFYSTARMQPKVAVHYTQKKFVNKPKGAAAGLVSLASFKTILVEPKVGTPAADSF